MNRAFCISSPLKRLTVSLEYAVVGNTVDRLALRQVPVDVRPVLAVKANVAIILVIFWYV
jgi:hypothetical protein